MPSRDDCVDPGHSPWRAVYDLHMVIDMSSMRELVSLQYCYVHWMTFAGGLLCCNNAHMTCFK